MSDRPSIPAALERQLMIDAGWKCSVPTCGTTSPLEIDHIDEWSRIHEHSYENLIVLCPTHHAMKRPGSKPREFNAIALRVIKQNQIDVAGRYGDIERRVLDHFIRDAEATMVFLPGDFDILLMRLLDGGLITKVFSASGSVVVKLPSETPEDAGTPPTVENSFTMRQAYELTDAGRDAVASLREARSLRM